ncbi:MAG: TonB-dependent receptor, partial [Methyloceanibacter sp.]
MRTFKLMGAVCLAALSQPAFAQDAQTLPADDETTGLAEIVVTARKSAENLQDVPVAVTAYTGDALAAQNSVKVEDIARLTPGFNAVVTKSAASSLYLTLRGQVQNDSLATVDPSVGIYVDEMYWARSYGVSMDLLDVSSVQVLKGPQGTLFGRNTTGGALLLSSNDPDYEDWSVSMRGSYASYDEISGAVIANAPLVAGKLAVRGAIQKFKRDGLLTDAGFLNNVGRRGGTKYNDRDALSWRLKAAYRPVDNLEVILSAESFEEHGNQYAQKLLYLYPGGPLANDLRLLGFTPADIDEYLRRNREDPDFISTNDVSNAEVKTMTYNGRLILDTGFGQLKAIGGYRRTKAHNALDLDGSVGARHFTDQNQDLDQWSGELQLTGSTANEAFDYAAGVSYLTEGGYDRAFSGTTFGIGPATTLLGIIDNDSWGVYGQGSWHITDTLSITGGLRYSEDIKRITINNRRATYAQAFSDNLFAGGVTCLTPTVGAPPTDALGNCVYSRSDKF